MNEKCFFKKNQRQLKKVKYSLYHSEMFSVKVLL